MSIHYLMLLAKAYAKKKNTENVCFQNCNYFKMNQQKRKPCPLMFPYIHPYDLYGFLIHIVPMYGSIFVSSDSIA